MILRVRLNEDTTLRVETIPEGFVEIRIEEEGGDNVGTLLTPSQAWDLSSALRQASIFTERGRAALRKPEGVE